ncbi:peptidoglycan hydrolase [Aliidiomarina shirensis]|uniref:Peptidoglycan hydrolase n=1 Tax=Aliidiomarina shirensis TaxID=1048642 RepID=A0A432WX73_9GAMM|nr:glucosaminidase domain-containing protein [Aliidiomarina shirensis]RUO38359.1 peptidoglycan hydrolase [Aliidiomarina shirensis]
MQIQKRFLVIGAFALVVLLALIMFWRGVLTGNEDGEQRATTAGPEGLPVVTLAKPRKNHNVPDFGAISDIPTRKIEFFSYLLPAINEQNAHILKQRAQIERLQQKFERGEALTAKEQRWLNNLASFYRVNAASEADRFATLLRRVDIIPDTLVLIQAANESGWGTSRFAADARNFFGQWCWTEGCGLVPASRGEGQIHEVREFNSVTESVRSYIRNLNTHDAYQDLRQIRAELRQASLPITAQPLTHGLMSYSERGEDYIVELNQMIRVNLPIIREVRESFESNSDHNNQTASAN